jgi:acyl-CoA thioesterase-2
MGGYVAAVALRAAGESSPFSRPASFFCHYLGVAAFDAVDVEVSPLRSGRTACSQRVSLSQQGRPILEAMVWSTGDVEGLEHHVAQAPDVPPPEELPAVEELLADQPPPFAFWSNVESRPVEFERTWPPPDPRPPVWRSWARFRPTSTFKDPWVDAARSVVLIDVQSWPSASRHHAWRQPAYIAPSLDLYVSFHEPAPEEAWLLADGYSPAAADGLIGWTGRLWTPSGRLVAAGGGQALCRPVPAGSSSGG